MVFVGENEALNQTRRAPNPARRRGRRKPKISNPSIKDYIIASLHWIAGTLGSMMSILQLPLAMMSSMIVTLLVLYWVYDSSVTAISQKLCRIPGISYLEICQPVSSDLPIPTPFFQDGLGYGSKLEEMQRLGADSVELPYYLRIGEGSVRSMIVQLGAVDLPSK